MKKIFFTFSMIMLFAFAAAAQKGIAEPGYYPSGYGADTWTGVVTAVDEATREFTLTYKKKDKEQKFTAVLPKGYTVKMNDGKDYELKMPDLLGLEIKIYYISKSAKTADGKKVKTNEAFRIKFIKD